MNTTELKTEIAKYIWYILTLEPYISMSWGIDLDSFVPSEDSLEFHVNGSLFIGNVRITFLKELDMFYVYFYDEESRFVETLEAVEYVRLVDVLDSKIEYNGPGFNFVFSQESLIPCIV